MDSKIIEKAERIISAKRLDCVMALIDLDGYPTASTITVSKNNGIKWLTFCTGYGTKSKRIEKCNRASICFMSSDPLYNITLVGNVNLVEDIDVKKEMWYNGLENHFKGYEDPNLCVLKFTTERYKLMIDGEETSIEGNI
jgi:general stress protein 26